MASKSVARVFMLIAILNMAIAAISQIEDWIAYHRAIVLVVEVYRDYVRAPISAAIGWFDLAFADFWADYVFFGFMYFGAERAAYLGYEGRSVTEAALATGIQLRSQERYGHTLSDKEADRMGKELLQKLRWKPSHWLKSALLLAYGVMAWPLQLINHLVARWTRRDIPKLLSEGVIPKQEHDRLLRLTNLNLIAQQRQRTIILAVGAVIFLVTLLGIKVSGTSIVDYLF